jgi:class I fructose-bisphosphate aldolase
MTSTSRPWAEAITPYAAASSTAASSGKAYRLGRIFGRDGNTLILPADHGTMLGRMPGLEDPIELVRTFLPLGCDGFLLGPGVIQRTQPWFAFRDAPARLLTIDSYWRGEDIGTSVLSISMSRAARLGVDGVKILMPWDVTPTERAAMAKFVGDVITAAEEHGLPVMVEPIVLASPRGTDAAAIEGDGCRIAAEMGADIIKVAYPGDADLFAKWCDELGVPVVILGGPPAASTQPLTDLVFEAIAAGARGITIGRRLWQRPIEEATELFEELVSIVHPNRV